MTKISNQYSLTNILTADLANSRLGINNVSPAVALDVTGAGRFSGSVTSDDLILTAGTLFSAGNTGFSNRLSDTTLYLQMPASGFNITDNALNTRFILSSAGAATFSGSVTASDLIISDTYANDPLIKLASTTSGSVEVQLRTATTTYNAGIGVVTSGYDFNFFTANSTRMTITSAGNVGIGNTAFANTRVTITGISTTSSNYGLVVNNSSNSNLFLVRDDGAVTVVGSLSKGSGSFRIDHPLKPDTHQLVHSFIEGPQADLIYRGKLTLVNGKAQANIDEVSTMTEGTFEALCREVQCFTTNENGWDLVKGKVIGNIIYIESQNSNSTDEISWMVIGERKDKHMMDTEWTDENGKVIVEPLKA